jgi:hypothetical protein
MGLRDALVVLLCAGIVLWFVRSIFSQWRNRSETPLRGKLSAAREWLEANGYRVLRVRERGEWIGYYGDKEFKRSLIADFIVRKGAKYYAVKLVQSRERGVNGAKLRDLWFPLYTAFQVQGILHVDVDQERVQVIDFEIKYPSYVLWRTVVNRSLWFLAGAVLALVWFHGR